MNLLTKTGLLPAVLETNNNYQKEQNDVSFNDIVLPAPFGFRPFSQYYNPYSNGCSILCNHPIDQDTKETIKKAKEILERKCVTVQRNYIALDDIDDVFVPEVLFRRYTETDSRPQTPTPTVTSITSKLSHPRRCITPDPTNEPEKVQLVLDLRRSLSQNAISSNEGHILSGVALSKPMVPKLSPKVASKRENNQFRAFGDKYSPKRQRKFETGKDKDGQKSTNVREKNVAETKEKDKSKKKKKSKTKSTKREKEADKEFKDLDEPKETQVSSYDDSVINEGLVGDQSIVQVEENNNKEHKQDRYAIDPKLIKQLQRELDLEVVDNESDPQKRMVYEEVYAKSITNRRSSAVDDEIKTLRREFRLNSLISGNESLFTLPRTFSRRSARFELPMSKTSFNQMTSLEYLKSHVQITNNSHLIYNEVFKLHLDTEITEIRLLPTKNLITALNQVMGREFTELEQNEFHSLVDLEEISHVDFRTWCGICAMCERIFGENFAQKYPSKDEDPCHEVELVDFTLLEKKLKDTNVDTRLAKILRKIRDI